MICRIISRDNICHSIVSQQLPPSLSREGLKREFFGRCVYVDIPTLDDLHMQTSIVYSSLKGTYNMLSIFYKQGKKKFITVLLNVSISQTEQKVIGKSDLTVAVRVEIKHKHSLSVDYIQ